MEKTFTPKMAADQLNLKASTLRSYSNQFEQNGYTFQRDASNRRLYIEKDIKLIHDFIELIHNENISKKTAIVTLLTDFEPTSHKTLEESIGFLTQQISTLSIKINTMEHNYEQIYAKLNSLENSIESLENPTDSINNIKKEMIDLNTLIKELIDNPKEKNSFWTKFQR